MANSQEHKEKMARKKARVWDTLFIPVDGKLSRALIAQYQLRNPGAALPIHPSIRAFDRLRVAVPASINRHTGKPHEHRREITRRSDAAALVDANRIKRASWIKSNRMHMPDGVIGFSRTRKFIGSAA